MLVANTVGHWAFIGCVRLREHRVYLTLLFNDYTFLQALPLYEVCTCILWRQ